MIPLSEKFTNRHCKKLIEIVSDKMNIGMVPDTSMLKSDEWLHEIKMTIRKIWIWYFILDANTGNVDSIFFEFPKLEDQRIQTACSCIKTAVKNRA